MAKLRDGRLGVNNFEEKYRYTVMDNVPFDVFKLILMAAIIRVGQTKYLDVITKKFYSVDYQLCGDIKNVINIILSLTNYVSDDFIISSFVKANGYLNSLKDLIFASEIKCIRESGTVKLYFMC